MLITYFKNPATLARCRSGLAHPYLEDFVVWLEQQGYRRRTICYHVFEVIHFANWAEAEGLARREFESRRARSTWSPNDGTQGFAAPEPRSAVCLSKWPCLRELS